MQTLTKLLRTIIGLPFLLAFWLIYIFPILLITVILTAIVALYHYVIYGRIEYEKECKLFCCTKMHKNRDTNSRHLIYLPLQFVRKIWK